MASQTHSVDPSADGLHAAGEEEWWREAWYFEFFDERSELQFQAYQGVFPNACTGDVNAAVFHRGKRVHQIRKMDFTVAPEPAAGRLSFGPMWLEEAEPLKRWRIRYDAQGFSADLVFTAVHAPFSWAASKLWLEEPADPGQGSHHFDQLGRFTGRCRVGGEEISVDTLGFRDRMWGWGGRKHWQSYLIMWAAFDEDCVANVAVQRFDDGRESLCGYLHLEGERSLLQSARGNVTWDEHRWKTIAGVQVSVRDALGRRFEFGGRPGGVLDTGHRWAHRNDHMLFSVGEYEQGGRTGHGVMNWAFTRLDDRLPRFDVRCEPAD